MKKLYIKRSILYGYALKVVNEKLRPFEIQLVDYDDNRVYFTGERARDGRIDGRRKRA